MRMRDYWIKTAGELKSQLAEPKPPITPPRHRVIFLYSPVCRWCKKVEPILDEMLRGRRDIQVLKLNVRSRPVRKLVKALGFDRTPVTIIDDRYVIEEATNYRMRLDFALRMVGAK